MSTVIVSYDGTANDRDALALVVSSPTRART